MASGFCLSAEMSSFASCTANVWHLLVEPGCDYQAGYTLGCCLFGAGALPLTAPRLTLRACRTTAGVIRGAARQNLGVIVNLGAYWVFGIPLSVALGLWAGWGVRGFWIGMAVTTTVQVVTCRNAVVVGVSSKCIRSRLWRQGCWRRGACAASENCMRSF